MTLELKQMKLSMASNFSENKPEADDAPVIPDVLLARLCRLLTDVAKLQVVLVPGVQGQARVRYLHGMERRDW